MGKSIHVGEFRRYARSTAAFTARDVELLTRDRGYALLMLHNMAARGELNRITRGWYSVHRDPIVSVFALRPAYVGLQEALSLHNQWEQETNVVIVTCGKAKPGVRKVMGESVVVHRIAPQYFFGFDYLPYGDFYIPVSDPEKTLIDLVYFGENPGTDVLRKAARSADARVMDGYLKKYPPSLASRLRRALRFR
jgi:predicted transcriptional regulator of viral defense system